MAQSVYLETTIPSYLAAWESVELSMAAKQQTTREWWNTQREHFRLFVSDAVILEVTAGDVSAAERRLEVLNGITILAPSSEADELAIALVDKLKLPDKAILDAVHIAICVVHRIDYLLTWNCRHIANATYQPIIHSVCDERGYTMPVICTPDQLMGDVDDSRFNS